MAELVVSATNVPEPTYEILKELSFPNIKLNDLGSFLVIKTDTPRYVIKKISLNRDTEKLTKNEISILKKLAETGCHSNILCYTEHFYTMDKNKRYVNLVTDAFNNSIDLFKFFEMRFRKGQMLKIEILLKIMYQILDGFNYIHSLGISHSDIKPENILINPKTYDIQIIDFGLSCMIDNSKKCQNIGTVIYTSPEILVRYKFGEKVSDVKTIQTGDCFSIGIVLFELANMKYYYNNDKLNIKDTDLLISNMISHFFTESEIKSKYVSEIPQFDDYINDIINSLLVFEPSQRATLEDSLNKITLLINTYNNFFPDNKIDVSVKIEDVRMTETNNNENNSNKYINMKKLGEGTFGSAYIALKNDTTFYKLKGYLIKPPYTYESLSEIMNEVISLKQLSNYGCKKNIECYIDHYFEQYDDKSLELSLITEYPYVDKFITTDYVIANLKSKSITYRSLITLMYQAIDALSYVHEMNISHNNIYYNSILINPNTLELKLTNFKLGCFVDDNSQMILDETNEQNENANKCKISQSTFMSPEYLINIKDNKPITLPIAQASDVYAMGIILYLLCNEYRHFEKLDDLGIFDIYTKYENKEALFDDSKYSQIIYNELNNTDLPINEDIEERINNIIELMKDFDPYIRTTALKAYADINNLLSIYNNTFADERIIIEQYISNAPVTENQGKVLEIDITPFLSNNAVISSVYNKF
jgi:serine/threonine protein kinase